MPIANPPSYRLMGDWELMEDHKMPPATRPLKGYWTLIASLAVVIVGQLQTWDWVHLIPAQYVGPVITGLAVMFAALRVITTTPPLTK